MRQRSGGAEEADGHEGHALAVGAPGAGDGHTEGQFLGRAARCGDGEEFFEAGVAGAAAAEEELLAVGGPGGGFVDVGMVGDALGDAAGEGDGIDVEVAIVFAAEGDGFAIGGEDGVGFQAGAGGEADGSAAGAGDAPEVAGPGEDDFGGAEGGALGKDLGGGNGDGR